ncbi:MAG: NUDIX hydrolase [Actinomycetota bacterium]|nr:NUDIX hydrolase [Actinomycetota bacterium]
MFDLDSHGPYHGDGFIVLADGSRRWGIYGAAGVLLRHRGDEDTAYFLALRSQWTHKGGTWAIPGGALNRGEEPLDGAMREFEEEIGRGLVPDYEIAETHVDDHGGWAYTTVVLDVPHRFDPPAELDWETAAVRWVREHELDTLELFDAFRATLVHLGYL